MSNASPSVGGAAAVNAYAFGNCTYYVATRYPNIYPYLGNALDWIPNAKKQGYKTLSSPAPDTIAVYGAGNGYSSLGHVAVVESVNSDGSFQVSEMNYTGFDVTDSRRSTMKGVVGFIVPPGSHYVASGPVAPSSTGGCVTGSFTLPAFPGTTPTVICMDGLLGVTAIIGGAMLMVLGGIVFVAFSLRNSNIGREAMGAASLIPGPWGAVAEATKAPPKPSETLPSKEEGDAASAQRMSVARARVRTADTEKPTRTPGAAPRTGAEIAAARTKMRGAACVIPIE